VTTKHDGGKARFDLIPPRARMTAVDTIAKIRAGRLRAASITQGELIEIVEAYETLTALHARLGCHDESIVEDLRRALEAAQESLRAADFREAEHRREVAEETVSQVRDSARIIAILVRKLGGRVVITLAEIEAAERDTMVTWQPTDIALASTVACTIEIERRAATPADLLGDAACTCAYDADACPTHQREATAVPHAAATQRVRERLAEMTPDEARETFVRSGIVGANGKLTARYGGGEGPAKVATPAEAPAIRAVPTSALVAEIARYEAAYMLAALGLGAVPGATMADDYRAARAELDRRVGA
jgi:hypothetical protein